MSNIRSSNLVAEKQGLLVAWEIILNKGLSVGYQNEASEGGEL